jgi:hypothetical protein
MFLAAILLFWQAVLLCVAKNHPVPGDAPVPAKTCIEFDIPQKIPAYENSDTNFSNVR